MAQICLNHQDRTAIATCSVCNKTLCESCIIRYKRYVFCSRECLNQHLSTERDLEAPEILARRKKIRVLVFIIVALVSISAFLVLNHLMQTGG